MRAQALFARLKHSSLAAVSTRQLTASFGWTASVAFQQHDVQELCQVLFEALARASVHLGRLLRLYEGKVIDYIQVRTVLRQRTPLPCFLSRESSR